MDKRQKRVLLVLGWYDYRLHRGIEKYALEHGWHLFGNLAREKVIPWGWEGDGILAWLGAGDDFAEFVTDAKKPTVDFSARRAHLPFARVLEDHEKAAALAAEHFISQGFKNFAFYSDTDNWSYEERGEGFQKALAKFGHESEWLRWHKSPAWTKDRLQWRHKLDWLSKELKKRKHPLAVFAASDEQALDVLEASEQADLAVPEEVAIIGAENYLLAPEAMPTPITSVDTDLETLGYSGAELLDRLMAGGTAPKEPIRIPPAGVISRKSSDLVAVNHKGVARALRYLRDHAHEPMNVEDLVRVAFMSRRGLHKAFVDHLGRTPGQELHRVRIEQAKRLLRDSDHKMEVVAGMCGYQSANSFCVAFKQATGMPPIKYRNSAVR